MRRLLILFAVALAAPACSAAESSPSQDMGPMPIVGADRDNKGCIPSAGYEWSQALSECIRIWEAGIELTHQGSGDPNYSAYAITTETDAELFLPQTPGSLLLYEDVGTGLQKSWTDATSEYRLTFDDQGVMVVTDMGGFVMYKDMSTESYFDDIPVHSEDELGGDLVMERGVVTEVEDGAYPMFTLHVRMDGEEEPTLLSFNAEAATVEGGSVYELAGQSVMVEYVDREMWDLVHIQPATAESMEDIDIGEGWRFVTGRVFGADQVSNGDLPDMVTIQMIDGDSVEFEVFIGPTLVELNETDITAWLAPSDRKEVISVSVDPS